MSRIQKKIDTIGSLRTVRQLQLDQQTAILQKIQLARQEAAEDLHKAQLMYIHGVDRLNQERMSPERKMLDALERSIDLAKARWHTKLQVLREVEMQERRQQAIVNDAHMNLKMLEKLDERYSVQLQKHNDKIEQKMLDEFAIQRRRNP